MGGGLGKNIFQEEEVVEEPTGMVDFDLLDKLFKFLRKEHRDDSILFFVNINRLSSLDIQDISKLTRYTFSTMVTCDEKEDVIQFFLSRLHRIRKEKLIIDEIKAHYKEYAMLTLLKYYQTFMNISALTKPEWFVRDESELLPIAPEKFNIMEKCIYDTCVEYPMASCLSSDGWSSSFVKAIKDLPLAISIADGNTFTAPGFPLIYVNRHFEVMTGYDRTYCLGKNCKFLQFFPDTRVKSMRVRKMPVESKANVSSKPPGDEPREEDDEPGKKKLPEVPSPGNTRVLDFQVAKEYGRLRKIIKKQKYAKHDKEDDQTVIIEEMAIALRSGCQFNIIIENYREDRSKFLMLVCLCPMFNNSGQYSFVVGLHYDITPLFDDELTSPFNYKKPRIASPYNKSNSRFGSPVKTPSPEMGSSANTNINRISNSENNTLISHAVSATMSPSMNISDANATSTVASNPNYESDFISLTENVENEGAKNLFLSTCESDPQFATSANMSVTCDSQNSLISPPRSKRGRISPGKMSTPAPFKMGSRYFNSNDPQYGFFHERDEDDQTNPGSVLKFVFLVSSLSRIIPRVIPDEAVSTLYDDLCDINEAHEEQYLQ